MEDRKLVEEFIKLVQIPSPSGMELDVAKHIMKRLKAVGADSYIDNVNRGTECNSGNVIAEINGTGPTIMFLAHIDTVEIGDCVIKPIVKNGVIKSDGKTILGADNKAGVASLIGAIGEMDKLRNRPNIICAFTVCEETSMLGARKIKIPKNINFIFDIDGGGPPGTFTTKALGARTFAIKFKGREAHAARAPEKGRHAIKAASLLVSNLKMGKSRDGSTLNVGVMRGGTRTNVIPGYAEVMGEVRAYKDKTISQKLAYVEKIALSSCRSTGCRYELKSMNTAYIPPFDTPSNQKIIRLAKAASEAAGLRFTPFTLDACVQANVLVGRGKFSVVELCRGGGGAHSSSEWTTAKNMVDTKNLILGIVKNTNRFVG